MGASKGNKNAYRNGSRIVVKRLVVGELPTSMIAVKREAREYRRGLEVDVSAPHDEPTSLVQISKRLP